jgi:hypothetical protein
METNLGSLFMGLKENNIKHMFFDFPLFLGLKKNTIKHILLFLPLFLSIILLLLLA